MARFERSKGRRRDSKDSFSKRDSRDSFEDRPRGRDSGRESNHRSRGGRELEMTEVTCSSCGSKCEVPFKPTSNKPLFCRDCFAKKDRAGTDKHSNRDLDIINKKLDKIMEALEIKD